MKSLKAQHHSLADYGEELIILNQRHPGGADANFQKYLERVGLYPLVPTALEILQMPQEPADPLG